MRSPESRIWVLPNRRTPGLAAVLVSMWYAGASQGNAAAYLLCFTVAGLALVSALHTWANIRGVRFAADVIPPVFAGEDAVVSGVVDSTQQRAHFALEIRARPGKSAAAISTLAARGVQRVELRRPASHRGYFAELRVRLSSSFPLGFFTARRDLTVRQPFYIYPAPHGTLPLPRALAMTRQPSAGTRVAGDDYGGARAWQPGESQRHIDWKAAARGQALLTKQWSGEAEEIVRLDWQSLGSLESEARLSQLAKWIVLAERGTAVYELRLPEKTFAAARGHTHYHTCLRALAEFVDQSGKEAA